MDNRAENSNTASDLSQGMSLTAFLSKRLHKSHPSDLSKLKESSSQTLPNIHISSSSSSNLENSTTTSTTTTTTTSSSLVSSGATNPSSSSGISGASGTNTSSSSHGGYNNLTPSSTSTQSTRNLISNNENNNNNTTNSNIMHNNLNNLNNPHHTNKSFSLNASSSSLFFNSPDFIHQYHSQLSQLEKLNLGGGSSKNSSPRTSVIFPQQPLQNNSTSGSLRGSLHIPNNNNIEFLNEMFTLVKNSPVSYHLYQSSDRRTPPAHVLQDYVNSVNSVNTVSSGTSTPRSRSTSIQNGGNGAGSPLPRSTSVLNLKSNMLQTSASSTSSNIELDFEYLIRFLRSKSELAIPSWEMNEQYYSNNDYNDAINQTLVRTLSAPKLPSQMGIGKKTFSTPEDLSEETVQTDSNESGVSSATTSTGSTPGGDIVLNDNGDLLSASFERVVDHLTDISRFTGTQYVEEFLFTYHYFMTPLDLLDKLKAKFDSPLDFITQMPDHQVDQEQLKAHVRLRVINVLKKWVEGHAHDFSDPTLYRPFSHFVDRLVIEIPKWGNYLKDIIQGPEFIIKNLRHTESKGSLKNHHGLDGEDKPQSMRELISLDNLGAISLLMFNSLVLKDRKKKMKTFKNSFLGNEAIDWLQQRFEIEKRDSARHVLTRLLQSNYFKHHSDKQTDDDDDSSSNSSNGNNGENSTKEFKDKPTIYYYHLEKDTYPEPLLPKSTSFSLLDVNPVEIARQLTLFEFNLFLKITPREFSHQAWAKPEAPDKVPNLIAFINRSNRVSYWVASEILSYNIKHRVSTLKRFIVIAEILKKLNNWNTFMSVMVGLRMGSVQRLKKTWEALPKNIHELFNDLINFSSEKNNYSTYRKSLQQSSYPCLPFMAIYLRDLTFTEENPDRLENGQINFAKMRMLARVLMEIDRYQTVPYQLKKIDSIEKLINPNSILTDRDLYRVSNQCEPQQRSITESNIKLERKKSFFNLGGKK